MHSNDDVLGDLEMDMPERTPAVQKCQTGDMKEIKLELGEHKDHPQKDIENAKDPEPMKEQTPRIAKEKKEDEEEEEQEEDEKEETLEDMGRNVCARHNSPKICYCVECANLLCADCATEEYGHKTRLTIRRLGEDTLLAVAEVVQRLSGITSGLKELVEKLQQYANESAALPDQFLKGVETIQGVVVKQLTNYLEEAEDLQTNLTEALQCNDHFYVFLNRFAELRARSQACNITMLERLISTSRPNLRLLVKKLVYMAFISQHFLGFLGGRTTRRIAVPLYVYRKPPNEFHVVQPSQSPRQSLYTYPLTAEEVHAYKARQHQLPNWLQVGDSIFLSGGSSQPRQMVEWQLSDRRQIQRAQMPVGRIYHELVCINLVYIYVVGGSDPLSVHSDTVRKCMRYDILLNMWKFVCGVPTEDLILATCVGAERYIYALTHDKLHYLDVYDEDDGWQQIPIVLSGSWLFDSNVILQINCAELIVLTNTASTSSLIRISKHTVRNCAQLTHKTLFETRFLIHHGVLYTGTAEQILLHKHHL